MDFPELVKEEISSHLDDDDAYLVGMLRLPG